MSFVFYLHSWVCANWVQPPEGGMSGEGINFFPEEQEQHMWRILWKTQRGEVKFKLKFIQGLWGWTFLLFKQLGPLTFFHWVLSPAFCSCGDGGGWPAGRRRPEPWSELQLKHRWWSAAGCRQQSWEFVWILLRSHKKIQYKEKLSFGRFMHLVATRGRQICTVSVNKM